MKLLAKRRVPPKGIWPNISPKKRVKLSSAKTALFGNDKPPLRGKFVSIKAVKKGR